VIIVDACRGSIVVDDAIDDMRLTITDAAVR